MSIEEVARLTEGFTSTDLRALIQVYYKNIKLILKGNQNLNGK